MSNIVYLTDPHHDWYADIIENHYEEARQRASHLVSSARKDENGCLVTDTISPRKVRFRGGQDRAYRFVYCITNGYAPVTEEVVRHRCHNRRCINPDHLTIGTAWDNRQDEYARRGNGVDFDLL